MIFRYINGIIRPLNLDNRNSEEFEKNFSKLSDQNYCRPTKCPKCGVKVYFIRHNGGSVWMDSLGYPWPKHGCFDNSKGHREIDILKSRIKKNAIKFLGLIVEVDVKAHDTRIAIRCNDNRVRHYLLSGKQNYLLGQIVTVKDNGSEIIISTLKKNLVENYEIPTIKRSEESNLIKDNKEKKSTYLKLKNKIENQKHVLNSLGIKFSNNMTSKELKELIRNENKRRRELKKFRLIEKLRNLNIQLRGNEKFRELKELNKKNSIVNCEIPTIKRSEESNLIKNNKEKTSKYLKLKNKIENQKHELNRLGIKFSNNMTSKELKELGRNENRRRRELKKKRLIENLRNLNIQLRGNEKFRELKELNKKYRNSKINIY